ncbi:DUF3301 domain-containing protein [Psychrosphaera ytuae]|uniref:DUF3301 domain-containing protein n=1 Tax=Psychrosphaera ytuae TaxID=2820710 RepID=A0A975HIN2_9GAMM|nr:DUF3301 domain-containing protein [Psychrosphaera ytuae]QTH64407.1 DUF3301 domain-containing protein [Psychrosphaera ytuae]
MFDLQSVWLLMLIAMVMWLFWQTRKVAERARIAGKQYCQQHHLQLLSIAMSDWTVSVKSGLVVKVFFDLNYSADGLTAKKGEIIIANGKVEQISHWS